MRITLLIEVLCGSDVARAVEASLRPDNVGLPEGLRLEVRASGGSLRIALSSDASRVLSLRSTADDVVRCLAGVLELTRL